MKYQNYSELVSTYSHTNIDQDGKFKIFTVQCRICLQQNGPFIIPCNCDGSVKYVHESCLKKWASANLKSQIKLEQQKSGIEHSNVYGVKCELCLKIISFEVRKFKRYLGWKEAKQSYEQSFLPFLPLFIFNVVIFLGCLSGALSLIAYSLMILIKKQSISKQNYIEHPVMVWGLFGFGFILCIVFVLKSLIELSYMFVREEHEVVKVISHPILTTVTEQKQHDCSKIKQDIAIFQFLSTPTSPHNINDQLLQNKLSTTRRNIQLKQKIAKELAERKLTQLKEFKKSPENSFVEETSITKSLPRKIIEKSIQTEQNY